MKVVGIILKILAVLAAIVGVIFLIVTYGDKVAGWFKRVFCKKKQCTCVDECECDCAEGECTCEGECKCETAEPVVEAAETEVVAAEADFEA